MNPKRTTFSSPSFIQRKRKLEQLLEEEKVTGASGLASKNTNYKNVKKLNCQKTVWNSCSSDSVLTFDSSVQWKQFSTDSKASDNTSNWDSLSKDVSSLVEVDELVNGSSLVNSENLIVQDQPLVESSDLISSSNSSSSEVKLQQAVRLLITQSDSESESESENLRRAVIPIGPKFQAELPEWMGPVNKGNLYGSDGDLETLKWLGTKIWPIEEVNPRSKMKKIGRGRPDSCSCVSPGSEDCIKCHMLSARHNLQSELGPAFLSWRFNEMGEVVSKTWTTKEQRMFESLAKNYLLSDRTNFWECAFKRFPSKCKRNILNYYYNVFIPRRMSQQTRSSLKEVVDSDEDQVDDDEDEGGDWRRCKYRYNR